MTQTVEATGLYDEIETEDPLQKEADRALLIGSVLTGTYFLSPIGVPYLVKGYRLLRKAERNGTLTRPWTITVIGAFSLIESVIFVVMWPTAIFSHDSVLMTTFWAGYGRLADGGYYIDWNATAVGGIGNPSEWTVAVVWSFLCAAPRVAASWYFLKSKRVGLQWMIITSYLSVALWIAFVIENFLPWNARIGASEFGLWAWGLLNLPFLSSFVLLPLLHQLNRERFSD